MSLTKQNQEKEHSHEEHLKDILDLSYELPANLNVEPLFPLQYHVYLHVTMLHIMMIMD